LLKLAEKTNLPLSLMGFLAEGGRGGGRRVIGGMEEDIGRMD
jgi:hypothetical protein